jgi:hypothetical protein
MVSLFIHPSLFMRFAPLVVSLLTLQTNASATAQIAALSRISAPMIPTFAIVIAIVAATP